MIHDYSNVLGRRMLYLGIIEQVDCIYQEAKNYTSRDFEMIREHTNLTLHIGLVVQYILVEITKL